MNSTENTQTQIRTIMSDYFTADVGGGWRTQVKLVRRNGKKVYNVEIGFNVYLDDPDRIITVVFPTEIPDGTPQTEWEKDLRELLERIANDFTGDITETLTNLEKIANENRPKKTNLQEFADKLDDYNLSKYKRYATQVTWDDWERQMLQNETENKRKKHTETDGKEKKQ